MAIKRALARYPALYLLLRDIWYRLRAFIECRVLGTHFQEWIWRSRHLYRRNWAQGYLETVGHPHREQIVEAVLSFAPVSSVLEVGCASGANLVCLRRRLPQAMLHGIDINRQAIAVAKQHFNNQGDELVRFGVGRADRLAGVADASIDVVLTDAVLMFLAPDRIRAVLSELTRVARRGIVLNEYHCVGETSGRFDGGRWVYDLVALLREQLPHADISACKSAFTGGGWDVYGALIKVRL